MNALILSATRRRALLGAALFAAATVLPGCTSQQLQGAGSSYLIFPAERICWLKRANLICSWMGNNESWKR